MPAVADVVRVNAASGPAALRLWAASAAEAIPSFRLSGTLFPAPSASLGRWRVSRFVVPSHPRTSRDHSLTHHEVHDDEARDGIPKGNCIAADCICERFRLPPDAPEKEA